MLSNIFIQAPSAEPARQQYFLEQAKLLFQEECEKAGRRLTASVITFGCQMNARDSEKLIGVLQTIGYEILSEDESADFVLYNTCTVRDNANQRVYGRLGVANGNKRRNPYLLQRPIRNSVPAVW